MPQPIFRYPLSYISYHTYSFTGFMQNEFEGTSGWGCPPGLDGNVPPNCPGVNGTSVLAYYEIMAINKWACLGILVRVLWSRAGGSPARDPVQAVCRRSCGSRPLWLRRQLPCRRPARRCMRC